MGAFGGWTDASLISNFAHTPCLVFGPGDPGLRRDMNRLAITACDLDPGKTYRVQVVGFNIFPAIRPETSELMQSAPPQ